MTSLYIETRNLSHLTWMQALTLAGERNQMMYVYEFSNKYGDTWQEVHDTNQFIRRSEMENPAKLLGVVPAYDHLCKLTHAEITIINMVFGKIDQSYLAPINGRINVTSVAIKRIRKEDIETPLEYRLRLEEVISNIVNDSKWL